MSGTEGVSPGEVLTSLPLPEKSVELLVAYELDTIHARSDGLFDPAGLAEALGRREGERVIGVDIGGDTIGVNEFRVVNGGLEAQVDELTLTHHSSNGEGYLDVLAEVGNAASELNIPVGISFAGPVEGTRPIGGPNVQELMNGLADQFDGDLANVVPTLRAVRNDAVAGLVAGATEVARRGKAVSNVIYLINGSGLGGAVLRRTEVHATEPGHVAVTAKLNKYGRQAVCEMGGVGETCIELVAASKAGIEATWLEQTGEALSGPEISARMQNGVFLARDMYDQAANVTAHAVRGLANAFRIRRFDSSEPVAVVMHGGSFKVPGFAARVEQILQNSLLPEVQTLVTYDFSENACLDGAAYAALSAE